MTDNQIYEKIFINAKEGFVLANSAGVIELVNPKIKEIFGYDPTDELIGENVEILIPMRMRKEHIHKREDYARKPVDRTMGYGRVLMGKRKDGSEIPLEISLSHFMDNDEVKVIGFVVDVTYRDDIEKKLKDANLFLEEKVKERTAELENSLEKGRLLNELKTRFVSIVSHEFRTPLSSIYSSATLLSKYSKSEEQEKRDKHINRIKSSVDNLIAILNDILTINRVEEGMFPVNIEPINIENVLSEVVEGLQALCERGQYIQYKHSGEGVFNTDKKLLLTILNNVISNAVKYSFDGGKVEISTTINGEGLTLLTVDQGIGIPLEEQTKLFQRFYRAANVSNIEGTGLGLNIVKKYVELLNGRITFRSKPDVKTEFLIKLPYYE